MVWCFADITFCPMGTTWLLRHCSLDDRDVRCNWDSVPSVLRNKRPVDSGSRVPRYLTAVNIEEQIEKECNYSEVRDYASLS